jgi:ATP-dependent Clp protease protease subunit
MKNKNEMKNKDEVAEDQTVESANPSDVLGALFGGGEDSLDKLGVMMIMDDVKNESVKPVIEWILKNNLSTSQSEHLTLILNSGGGSVTDAFALIDTMRGSGIPIHTIGLGEVSSAALMIFMAGKKGHRILTPNTSILSHQYSWGKWGKEHELLTASRGFELSSKMITNHYIKCTGLSEKKIRDILLPPHDVWLSAAEAKKYGICDVIKDLG